MQIESPFGPLEILFHRNNHCTVQARGMNPIIINGVELAFHKDLAIIDGQWQLAEYEYERAGQGKFNHNSFLHIRFHDWQRTGSPSRNAYNKLKYWIVAFLLADLNSGKYTAQLNAAERNSIQALITNLRLTIDKANTTISECNSEICKLQTTLTELP